MNCKENDIGNKINNSYQRKQKVVDGSNAADHGCSVSLLGCLKNTANRAGLNITVLQLKDICPYQVPIWSESSLLLKSLPKAFQNECTCKDEKRSPQDARTGSGDIKHRLPTVLILGGKKRLAWPSSYSSFPFTTTPQLPLTPKSLKFTSQLFFFF